MKEFLKKLFASNGIDREPTEQEIKDAQEFASKSGTGNNNNPTETGGGDTPLASKDGAGETPAPSSLGKGEMLTPERIAELLEISSSFKSLKAENDQLKNEIKQIKDSGANEKAQAVIKKAIDRGAIGVKAAYSLKEQYKSNPDVLAGILEALPDNNATAQENSRYQRNDKGEWVVEEPKPVEVKPVYGANAKILKHIQESVNTK